MPSSDVCTSPWHPGYSGRLHMLKLIDFRDELARLPFGGRGGGTLQFCSISFGAAGQEVFLWLDSSLLLSPMVTLHLLKRSGALLFFLFSGYDKRVVLNNRPLANAEKKEEKGKSRVPAKDHLKNIYLPAGGNTGQIAEGKPLALPVERCGRMTFY